MNKELREALGKGDLDKVKELVKNGVDIKEKSNSGFTALILAAGSGGVDLIEYLLTLPDANIREQATHEDGDNVLSYAAWHYRTENVAFLLKKGAYVDMLLNNGCTARKAVQNFPLCSASYNLLCAAENLFSRATGQTLWDYQDRTLLERLGESLNGRQINGGNTALHLAIRHKQEGFLGLLLEANADVLMPNDAQETPHRLLQVLYSDNAYFCALSHVLTLRNIEAEFELNKKHGNIPTELKKIRESQRLAVREIKEIKERKERNENVKMLDVQSAAKQIKDWIEKAEKTVNTVETFLDRLTQKQLAMVCFRMGRVLSNQNSCLFNPAGAYRFLSRIVNPTSESEPKNSQLEEIVISRSMIQEAHKIMLELLVSKQVIFEFNDLDDEVTPINTAIELDGKLTLESDKARELRLKNIIRHALYSETIHRDVLGGYVAEYAMGFEYSVKGVKGFKGNDNESICALIEFLKEQVSVFKSSESTLKKLREENEKMRQELMKLRSSEKRENKEIKENKDKREQPKVAVPKMNEGLKKPTALEKPLPVVIKPAKAADKPVAFSNAAAVVMKPTPASSAQAVQVAAAGPKPVPGSNLPTSKIAQLKQQLKIA